MTLKEKQLDKQIYLKRNRERPWYKHWKACRQRCNDKNASNYKWYGGKGIKCQITSDEVSILWKRDNASQIKEAHLSRKEHDKDYTFDNCYFIDKKNNVGESNQRNKRRIILQYTLNGRFLRTWSGAIEINKILEIDTQGIRKCAQGIYSQSHGFIWRYK